MRTAYLRAGGIAEAPYPGQWSASTRWRRGSAGMIASQSRLSPGFACSSTSGAPLPESRE
jgi:hypothetical protein